MIPVPSLAQYTQPFPRRLNLGCGQFPLKGMLNIDHDPAAKADALADLGDLATYRQLPENHFDYIVMDHVLEHLDDIFGIMRELHRVLTPGGLLELRVPHFSRGITHPEHRHGFDVTFPAYMDPAYKGGYIGVPFHLESMRLDYMIRWDLKKTIVPDWQIALLKPLNAVVTGLANAQPYVCSRFWCYLVGGFEQIEYRFRKPSVTS